jgi:hypothetical protein
MFKYLPVSIELVKAASLDERADRGQRQETDIDHLLLPAEAPEAPPAIAAAAAPVATLTEQQQQQILTALERQLTPIGRAAYLADACRAFGAEALAAIPAEHHSALMQSLANAGSRERWNRGCGHVDGEPLLTAEQIAELTPQAPEAPEQAAPRAARQATRAAAPAAPSPAPEPEPADEEQEEPGDDLIQSELV